MIIPQIHIPVLRVNAVVRNILLLALAMAGIPAGCGDAPENTSPPYQLTEVEITPQEPAFADTVRIEVHGEPNPGSGRPAGEEAIDFYNWHFFSEGISSSEVNHKYYINENYKDTVSGRVWGRFKQEESPHTSSTGKIPFEIIYHSNGEQDE